MIHSLAIALSLLGVDADPSGCWLSVDGLGYNSVALHLERGGTFRATLDGDVVRFGSALGTWGVETDGVLLRVVEHEGQDDPWYIPTVLSRRTEADGGQALDFARAPGQGPLAWSAFRPCAR